MSRQKRGPSLFRRLIYFVVLLISGGGAGGYALQDNPVVKSVLSVITGQSPDGSASGLDGSLVKDVVAAIKKVELDQKLFRPGHTVDIQARVKKLESGGRSTTVWESKSYGSRLAVVGKDELSAGWSHRPFQVQWNTGDQFVLEVYDAQLMIFMQPRRFTMARADSGASEFPLRSGDFPLESAQASDPPINPRTNHVVLQTERVGNLRSSDSEPAQVAERPVIIR
jgi:hypothetical protein